MHASRLDVDPVLVQLGFLKPPVTNVFVPTPNHSHVLINADINLPAIWWQVRPVLVLHQSDWASKEGSTGLPNFGAMQDAIKAGLAIEAPSNLFLFFHSKVMAGRAM
jgi:hypothetical protein